MNLTAEEIRILISWYAYISATGVAFTHDDKLLEKLRAELRRLEDEIAVR